MRGTISITDWEWFLFLREESGGMIVGFRIFAGHVVQPLEIVPALRHDPLRPRRST